MKADVAAHMTPAAIRWSEEDIVRLGPSRAEGVKRLALAVMEHVGECAIIRSPLLEVTMIENRMNALANLGAGWVLWLLVVLSVIGLAVVLERCLFMLRTRGRDDTLTSVLSLLREGRKSDLLELLRGTPSVEARVLEAGISGDGVLAARERMEGALKRSDQESTRGISFLSTLGSNAPFVGLLGTVIGIVRAFAELSSSAGQVSQGLMTEVGEALIATAVGILVAIPAVAFFNLFSRITQSRRKNAEASAHDLIAALRSLPAGGLPNGGE